MEEAMSERLSKIEDTVGKTVLRVAEADDYHSIIALFFTDGTYVCITSESSYGDYPSTTIYTDSLSDTEQFSLGLITKDELGERRRIKKQGELKQREAHERRQLDELKRKYETSQENKL
jgi:hypothetical protein